MGQSCVKGAIAPPIERESGQNSRTGDVAADGNVSKSGDVGGGSGEEISFLFNSPKALESDHPEIGLRGW